MKKNLNFLLVMFFSISLFGQEKELTNYEKYRIQKEMEEHPTLYYDQDTIKKDTVIVYDTVYVDADYDPMVINNYYNDYNQPNYRFRLTFGYIYPYYHNYWYYNSWHYDPWYYDYYSWHYPYYTHYYPYRYYSYYNTRYYRNYPRYNSRYYSSVGTLGRTRYYSSPYRKTYASGNVNNIRPKRTSVATRTTIRRQPVNTSTRTVRGVDEVKRTYTEPRMSRRPSYNKTTQPRYNNRNLNRTSTSSRTYKSTISRTNRSTGVQSRTITPIRRSETNVRSSSQSRNNYTRSSSSGVRRSSTINRSSSSGVRSSGTINRSSSSSRGSATRSSSSGRGRRK